MKALDSMTVILLQNLDQGILDQNVKDNPTNKANGGAYIYFYKYK